MSPLGRSDDDPTPRHAARTKRRWPLIVGVGALALVLIAAGGVGLYLYQASRSATENLARTDLLPAAGGPTQHAPEWEEVTPEEGSKVNGSKGNGSKGNGSKGNGSKGEGSNGGASSTGDSGDGSDGGSGPPADRSGKPGALNVVLMGSDSQHPSSGGVGRSDTLMLLHLDADRRAAYLISFPRDMYVPIPGHGMNKINAAHAFGGSQLTIQTLQNMMGIEIDHAALVSFDGFIDLTDEVGGVTIVNDYSFSSRGYSFGKGEIYLSGEKALAFVRARYELPNGDLDRAKNQRKVVEAILAKGLSGDTIANPRKFNNFVGGVASNVTVDQELSDGKIRKLALSLRMNPKDIQQLQAPLTGFASVPGVGSVDVVDRVRLEELGAAIRTDTIDEYRRNGG